VTIAIGSPIVPVSGARAKDVAIIARFNPIAIGGKTGIEDVKIVAVPFLYLALRLRGRWLGGGALSGRRLNLGSSFLSFRDR
jgi:hypothetical protein